MAGPAGLPEDAVSIGENVWVQRIGAYPSGEWVGVIEWHLDPAGELCGGYVAFAGFNGLTDRGQQPVERPTWTVVSLDPLTLAPSLQCLTCPHHGFIRDGKWLPA